MARNAAATNTGSTRGRTTDAVMTQLLQDAMTSYPRPAALTRQ